MTSPTVLINRGEYSAYIMTDDVETTLALIETHKKATRCSALKPSSIDSFDTVGMSADELAQVSKKFDHVPTTIYQFELSKGPGGLIVAASMIKRGDASEY